MLLYLLIFKAWNICWANEDIFYNYNYTYPPETPTNQNFNITPDQKYTARP